MYYVDPIVIPLQNTIQYSTAQHSTIQYNTIQKCPYNNQIRNMGNALIPSALPHLMVDELALICLPPTPICKLFVSPLHVQVL